MSEDYNSKSLLAAVGTTPAAPAIPSFVVPVDMTEIVKYEQFVEELTSVNDINAPFYMREFLKAKELASSYHAKSLYRYEIAKISSKKLKALAYLDKAGDLLSNRGMKITDKGREMVAEMDLDYIKSKEEEAYFLALYKFMENKVFKFQSAHDDAKKIYDKTYDSRGSITGASVGNDGQ